MALTKIDDRGLKTPIDLLDNEKIRFGTGNDLEIFHNGSQTLIDNNTGTLAINTASSEVQINKGTSEYMGRFIVDGSVELYYDNSKKLNTNANGVHITDKLTFANTGDSVLLADNQFVSCGNGGDLKIFHDGSNSYISDAGTGQLKLTTNQFRVKNAANNESMIDANENGNVVLCYDNSTKFETIAGGVKATGYLTCDGIYMNSDNDKAFFGAGNDLQIWHNGTNSYLKNTTGMFYVMGDDLRLVSATGAENYFRGILNGAVELYHDNVKRFETDNSGNVTYKRSLWYSNSNKDEGLVGIYAWDNSVDQDTNWLKMRRTDSVNPHFAVDGRGRVLAKGYMMVGTRSKDDNTTSREYLTDDYIGYYAHRGITDGSAYRDRVFMRTASADWDDRRVFYYVSAQADSGADYDQDQTISFSGSGRGNFLHSVWAGRVESDESSPNSVYAGGERGFHAYGNDADDETLIIARTVADSSFVFYSEVNGEANVEIEADGSARTDGTWSNDNADYAECFEWTDGNGSAEERRGMTVVLDGEKVKLATDSDNKDNIIGVVSPEPVVLGDAAPLGWHGRYKKDVYGSAIRKEQEWLVWKKEYHYEDGVKVLCAQPDPNKPQTLNKCERVRVEDIETQKAKNLIPDFAITNNIRYKTYGKDVDTTTYDSSKPYVPRKDRKEWDAIGMVGKLVVRRGQPVGTRWLLMKENIGTDTDGTVLDRYLVR